MTDVAFDAFDHHRDGTFTKARYRLRGSTDDGWRVERDGALALRLGPGYRALRVRACGVCSTDLARRFLPFPLPQVIGHEVVVDDEDGARYVVEINASHLARGVAHECAFCAAGLPTHCPERVTLGIHDLPGGFGPWILAPVDACLPVPDELPDDVAVLVEPFAAALHAVTTVAPRSGERVAVLGPRRLGMLVVAALAAKRGDYAVEAVVRDPALAELARQFGAERCHVLAGEGDDEALAQAFDVVIDTTGSPAGLERAVRLARREVHLKSTHGQLAAGVRHLTELVVDELSIARCEIGDDERALVARLEGAFDAAAEAERWWSTRDGLPRADAAIVASIAGVEAAIRPVEGREEALVRPRGELLLRPDGDYRGSPLLQAIAARGLRLTSSRCGDFAAALELLRGAPSLRSLGERLVTHRFDAAALPEAFRVAGSRECVKAVIRHVP